MGLRPVFRRLSYALPIASLLLSTVCTPTKIGQASSNGGASDLQEAKNAYFRRDLPTARQKFEKTLLETSSRPEERAEAARRLAGIAWRFDHDWEQALSYLSRAEDLESGAYATAIERARILERQDKLDQALSAARQAVSRADSGENRIEALTTVGRLALLQSRKDARQSNEPDEWHESLRETLAQILPVQRADGGRLEMSRVVLALGLLTDDGVVALDAWRSYYWIPPSLNAAPTSDPNESPATAWDHPLLSVGHSVLSEELPGWQGPDSSAKKRIAVVKALASTRFFREAAWLATDSRVNPEERIDGRPEISEIVAYHRFLEAIQESSEDYYRRRALAKGANRELRDGLMAAARTLWTELHWNGPKPALSYQGLLKAIGDRFGAYVYFQTHGDIRSLNMGHRILDHRRLVEQYGRSAEVRLIVLDSMVTNGYNSWFWDGAASAGGWVDQEGSIVQVRPSYADGPLRAWTQLTDPGARRQLEERITEQSAADEAIARAEPFSYLPGLALRMRRQVGESLSAELRGRGLNGADLKLAFINELSRRTWASSILAHEGRHALDFRDTARNFFRSSAEKEFRAKLSEVALAPDPRIALTGGILNPNIGDESSHGQANQRIMKGLFGWMDEHRSAIQGFDSSRPILPQLDLLTDDQLRDAFRSMDPWAK